NGLIRRGFSAQEFSVSHLVIEPVNTIHEEQFLHDDNKKDKNDEIGISNFGVDGYPERLHNHKKDKNADGYMRYPHRPADQDPIPVIMRVFGNALFKAGGLEKKTCRLQHA